MNSLNSFEILEQSSITSRQSKRQDFTTLFIKFNQYISSLIVYPIFSLFFDVRINGQHNIDRVDGPLIIVANHVGWYDSFLFRMLLAGNTRLLPLRFMGSREFLHFGQKFFYKIGIIPIAYKLFGVFYVTRGQGLDRALASSKEILAEGGVVAIYPEGRLNLKGPIAPFKRGASALSLQTGVSVLPVAFRREKKHKTGTRRHLFINVGQPTHIPTNLSYDAGAEYLKKVVEGLYEKAGK